MGLMKETWPVFYQHFVPTGLSCAYPDVPSDPTKAMTPFQGKESKIGYLAVTRELFVPTNNAYFFQYSEFPALSTPGGEKAKPRQPDRW